MDYTKTRELKVNNNMKHWVKEYWWMLILYLIVLLFVAASNIVQTINNKVLYQEGYKKGYEDGQYDGYWKSQNEHGVY